METYKKISDTIVEIQISQPDLTRQISLKDIDAEIVRCNNNILMFQAEKDNWENRKTEVLKLGIK